jgi:hypothetical protein
LILLSKTSFSLSSLPVNFIGRSKYITLEGNERTPDKFDGRIAGIGKLRLWVNRWGHKAQSKHTHAHASCMHDDIYL